MQNAFCLPILTITHNLDYPYFIQTHCYFLQISFFGLIYLVLRLIHACLYVVQNAFGWPILTINIDVLQNAFGILTARWRCLLKPLHMQSDNATSIVLACCVLHNFLLNKKCQVYMPPGFADSMDVNHQVVDGRFREQVNDLRDIAPTRARNPPVAATTVRDTILRYVNDDAPLHWQLPHINRV